VSFSATIDAQHMARALSLARKGLYSTDPNPRVGCVIVDRHGEVVGEGWHQRAGQAHAEVLALQQAGSAAQGARAYVTLEPCSHHGRTPPCADALIRAGVASVVCAMQDPNPLVSGQGIQRLRQAGIAVEVGLMQAQAEQLNIGFVSRMRHRRAYVRLKLAQSLDGRSAMESGESQWITSPAARQDVHRLRARSSAIITGIDSVLVDDPRMSVRLDDGPSHQRSQLDLLQPKRVVLDSRLRLPPQAKILDQAGTIVYCSGDPQVLDDKAFQRNAQTLLERQVEVRRISADAAGNLDLAAIIDDLSQHDQCNEILVEAGARLSGAMLQQRLVDELWLYLAPCLMGSSARPSFQIALQQMQDKLSWRYRDTRFFGPDLRIRLLPAGDAQAPSPE